MNTDKECRFTGCDKTTYAKGLCQGHYTQSRNGEALRPLRTRKPRVTMLRDLPCEYLECDRTQYSKGLCAGHYGQHRRGNALRPIRSYTRAA